MANSWVTVRGVLEARGVFQALPATGKAKLTAANTETVKEIAKRAQDRIARSPSIRTRALYNAIAWSVSKASGFGRVGVARTTTAIGSIALRNVIRVRGTIVTRKNGTQEAVQPSRYAHLVEYGTIHAGAEPFMGPSAAEAKPKHIERCRAAGAGIEREAAR